MTVPINAPEVFSEKLGSYNPTICVFETLIAEEMFGWQVHNQFPNCVRICDTQDLRFLRKFRESMVSEHNVPFQELKSVIPSVNIADNDLINRELASLHRCDLNLIVSSYEMEILERYYRFPSEKLCISPFYYQNVEKSPKPYSNRKNFFMIGNFNHTPNTDAIEWMKSEIWPKIHPKIPHAKLDIFGALVRREHMEMTESSTGFRVRGHMENLENIQNYRVQLAPLRFGAGIKGKIADAWEFGTPSVTTWVGTEGMKEDGVNDWGGYESSTIDEFVDHACKLYQDEEIWKTKQENGYRILKNLFDKDHNERILISKVNQILKTFQENRKFDVSQSILWDINKRVTEMKARSIIEKNRINKLNKS